MKKISEEVLSRYVTGAASLEEIAKVSLALKEDESLRALVDVLEGLNSNGILSESGDLPMASSAAMAEDNLCDVMCEQYILKDYLGGKPLDGCVSEMLDNCWFKESGTPLHNMGRLLEKYGMAVSRRYDCSMEDIAVGLRQRYKLIAVVDYGQLWSNEADGIYHAVCCLSILDGTIRIYDPAMDGCSNYLLEDFEKAWAYSKHYLVQASSEGMEYIPHPIDVTDVDLDDQLMELSEAIAENAHEIWAEARRSEGWRFGPTRNDVRKEHPDMIPYYELPEGEKYYDRAMALNTIRLVKKLGFNIGRKNTRYCPCCGEFVADNMIFCPRCGKELPKED